MNRLLGYFEMTTETSDVGARVVALREAVNLNRKQLSDATGVAYEILTNIELGRSRSMTYANAVALAKQLQTTPEYILSGVKDDSEPPKTNTLEQEYLDIALKVLRSPHGSMLRELLHWCSDTLAAS